MKILNNLGAVFVLVFALALSPALCFVNQDSAQRPVKPSPRDKCPVCGMFVAKYPDFLAQILFNDGTYAVFDGTKDMFKFYFQMTKYQPDKKPSDIVAIYVTDYYNLTLINGYEAYYVVGSDIFGPMGKELIPHGSKAEAGTFLSDHKGDTILKFEDITVELIEELN